MLEIFSCNSIESAKPIEGWREVERGVSIPAECTLLSTHSPCNVWWVESKPFLHQQKLTITKS